MMQKLVACLVMFAFAAIALVHVYWALYPKSGRAGGVPTVKGKPLFVPSAKATAAIGAVLLLCAALVGATAGLVPAVPPIAILPVLCYFLALGLLLRAIGDFKYVGFFKADQTGRFARLDTWVYSPLCILLALGVALVATESGS